MNKKRRNFLKWQLGGGKRGTLRRAARKTGNGLEALGAAIAVVDYARAESHWIGNPEAIFTTTIDDIGADYCVDDDRVREALHALRETKFISIAGNVDLASCESDELLTVKVVNYLKFNDPQGSDADRKTAQRHREEMQKVQAFVTAGHMKSHEVTRREEIREEERTPPPTPAPRKLLADALPPRPRGGGASAEVEHPHDVPFSDAVIEPTKPDVSAEWKKIDEALATITPDQPDVAANLHEQIVVKHRSMIRGRIHDLPNWARATVVACRDIRRSDNPPSSSEVVGWIVQRLEATTMEGSDVDVKLRPVRSAEDQPKRDDGASLMVAAMRRAGGLG